MRLHLLHSQSLHGQYLLWPLRRRDTPWFRHRAQVGAREGRSTSELKLYGCVVIMIARERLQNGELDNGDLGYKCEGLNQTKHGRYLYQNVTS